MEYESLGRPIVTTEDAIRANSYVENLEPSVIKVGDARGKTVVRTKKNYAVRL